MCRFKLVCKLLGISKNPAFYGLNPSPFSGREGYKEFLEMPLIQFKTADRIINCLFCQLPIFSAMG